MEFVSPSTIPFVLFRNDRIIMSGNWIVARFIENRCNVLHVPSIRQRWSRIFHRIRPLYQLWYEMSVWPHRIVCTVRNIFTQANCLLRNEVLLDSWQVPNLHMTTWRHESLLREGKKLSKRVKLSVMWVAVNLTVK